MARITGRRNVWVLSFFVVFMSTAILSQNSMAQGLRNPPMTTAGIGRTAGSSTLEDDSSALIYNPANIAEIESSTAQISLTFGYEKKEFKPAVGGKTQKTEDPWALLPSISAAWPVNKGKFVAGIGMSIPYGRAGKWNEDVSFRFSSPFDGMLGVVDFQPTIAAKCGDFRIGVGANIYYSEVELNQFLPWFRITGAPTPDGRIKSEADGTAFGASVGITWIATERQELAFRYTAPFDIEYDGDFNVSNIPEAGRAMGVTSRSDYDAEIKFPSIVTLGYGLKLSESVKLGVDIEWQEHSRSKEIPIDASNNNVLLPFNAIPQNFEDTWMYGAGIDWEVSRNWTTRTGVNYIEAPSPTSTLLPIAAEDDFIVVAFGLEYAGDKHSFQFAYLYSIFNDDLEVTDNPDPTVNGVYDIDRMLVSISYGINF